MKPDNEYYRLDDVALMKAGIDPRECFGFVEYAVKNNLPGCHKALSYLEQLIEQTNSGQIQPCVYREPEDGLLNPDYVYISKEDAERWQPEAPPIQPVNDKPKPSNPSDELIGKSKTAHQQTIIGLVEYVIWKETGKPNPEYFKNRDIVLNNGRLSAEALRELLQAMYPDTPNRAEEIIKEALKLKVKKLDD